MCKTKASTDVSTPAAIAAVVLTGAAISSAAAVITSVLVAVLVTMLVLSAAGITGFIVLLRREGALWRPAAARSARVRPELAARPVIALPVPSLRAIEGPAVISGVLLADADDPRDMAPVAGMEMVPARA
ncbi:MAG TPA: hypothetical protein VHU92_05090 [Streptosporangiaceae bacterium]|jgi:hypothetical protein|nr:hypothetical protein [Streptosporangiaceae bacterium]